MRTGPKPKDPASLSIFRKQKLKILMTPEEKDRFSKYHAEKNRKKMLTPMFRAQVLFASARTAATKRNLLIDITRDWVKEKLCVGVCEVTGLPFVFESRNTGRWGAGSQQPFAPSLDRTDPTKGYTKDNVKVVVWIYNRAKQDSSHEEVLMLARALVLRLTESGSVV